VSVELIVLSQEYTVE